MYLFMIIKKNDLQNNANIYISDILLFRTKQNRLVSLITLITNKIL